MKDYFIATPMNSSVDFNKALDFCQSQVESSNVMAYLNNLFNLGLSKCWLLERDLDGWLAFLGYFLRFQPMRSIIDNLDPSKNRTKFHWAIVLQLNNRNFSSRIGWGSWTNIPQCWWMDQCGRGHCFFGCSFFASGYPYCQRDGFPPMHESVWSSGLPALCHFCGREGYPSLMTININALWYWQHFILMTS